MQTCSIHTDTWTNHSTVANAWQKLRKLFILMTNLWKRSFCQALLNHLPKLRWKKIYKHGVWLYVMPAVSQSEPQDAYREVEKANIQGCPFCIVDAFPSHKYRSSPKTLQNRFTQNRPVVLTHKGLDTWAYGCVYVRTVLIEIGWNLEGIFRPAGESLFSSRDGASGRVSGGLGKLKADEERIPQLPLVLTLFHSTSPCQQLTHMHTHTQKSSWW